MTRRRTGFISSLLGAILFYPAPAIAFDRTETEQYEALLASCGEGRLIPYALPYPKLRFLQYVASKNLYVFHGSNRGDIACFEPREQTLYNDAVVKAVFASPDPIWASFFAIFDRSRLAGSFRNGCLIGGRRRYHYYSINRSTMNNRPWTGGTVYILPKLKFARSAAGTIEFDEWICREPVRPIASLAVAPDDFYFKRKVAVHPDRESLPKTWLLYKVRTLRRRPVPGQS